MLEKILEFQHKLCQQFVIRLPMDLKNLLHALPSTLFTKKFIAASRKTATDIFLGQDVRKVVIVGPCSIHSVRGALDYGKKIKLLQKKVKSRLFLVMRAFIEKPRTKKGWKGFMYDPDLNGSNQLHKGIALSRKLLLELAALQVPVAMEFLDINASSFFQDLITWGFIGARTSMSQPHRQLASWLKMPIGIKNGLDGHVDDAIHSVESARSPQHFLHVDKEGGLRATQSEGNPHAHIVLRGGRQGPNFHNIYAVKKQLIHAGLDPKIMIDCAHDNSAKLPKLQAEVFKSVGRAMLDDSAIFGMMLESHLLEGSQSFPSEILNEGLSITDPCLGWEETENLILDFYQELSKGGASSKDSFSTSCNSSFVGITSS